MNLRSITISANNVADWNKYCDNTIVTSRYTIITFLPKVLYEQFRRISNFFFLTLIILQLSLEVPTDPSAYIIAFGVVIVVSTIRQAYEDWLRHSADQKLNQRKFYTIDKDGELKGKKSRDLRVGQLIQISENDSVPADVLFLSCVDSSGNAISKCEITTANLDGEPNQKIRRTPHIFPKCATAADLAAVLNCQEYFVEYDKPNADLYKFNGLLKNHTKKSTGINMDNILLRGTTLKNCSHIFGCIIYTGKETRLSLNSTKVKKNKFSLVDTATNRLVYFMFGLLFILCSIATGLYFWNENSTWISNAWYLPNDGDSDLWQGIITFLLFLILMSYMIPISLSVTIEIQRFGCSKFFGWDNDMRCEKRGVRAICNTSDLNEELGQINYLLTDKTGTLTENNLRFAAASIGGQKVSKECISRDKSKETIEFMEAIALCHTVNAVTHANVVKYNGASPDEEILVSTAHDLGVSFIGESESEELLIQSLEHNSKFKRHFVLDFDSDRKAMSVIIETENGRVYIISKGAESSLLPKCEKNSSKELLQKTTEHVTEFAEKGYRTLVIAKREISKQQLKEIFDKMELLCRAPEKLQSYYSELESDLTILGVTAVEDELQENVEKTLEMLKKAGIRIWMITGDKLETALNIGRACGLVPVTSVLYKLADIHAIIHLNENLECIQNEMNDVGDCTLVIDGATFALGFQNNLTQLAEICKSSSQVIFCRMAPLQKAQVIKLIQAGAEGFRVCAVGDGGNDVAMIQEAHIGIGIVGREGTQAVRASDFSVPNFKSLQKAILVHGYWYYYRVAVMVSYFFYRGLLFVLPQLFYGIVSGFSGQTVYHSSYMMCYSLVFSATPIPIHGLTEQPKSREQLLENPALYRENAGNALLSWKKGGAWWTCTLIWHTFLICVLPPLIWPSQFAVMDWGMMSHFIAGIMVAVTNIKVVTDTVHFNWFTLFGQVFSYGSMLLFYSLSSELLKSVGGGELKFVYFALLSRIDFWCTVILICVLSSLPDLVYGGIRRLGIIQASKRTATNKSIFAKLFV